MDATNATTIVVLAFLVLPRFAAAEEHDDPRATQEDEYQAVTPDWNLLRFSERRTITGVRLFTTDLADVQRIRSIERLKETRDPERLRIVSAGLEPSFVLRYAIPDDHAGGGGIGGPAGVAYAVMQIKTTEDMFEIGITPRGFVLQSRSLDFKNVFFSYALAEFVEDTFHEQTGLGLRTELFRGLSGELQIDASRRYYRSLARKSQTPRAPQANKTPNERKREQREND